MVIGLVGRRIAGDRAVLLAAALAAVYPMLWINDGMLVSESMYILLVAAILLAAYRLWASRHCSTRCCSAAAIGLGCLTRPEAVMLVPLIGVPFLLREERPCDCSRRIVVVLRWERRASSSSSRGGCAT